VVLFSLGFSVPGLLALAGALRFPWDPVLAYASSLLLAAAFLAMLTALHHTVTASLQVWTHLAVLFAGGYAVLAAIVYFVGLSVVVPLQGAGRGAEVALLRFDDAGSLMQALDGLAYFLMCLSTLSASMAVRDRENRWLRRMLVANGLLGLPILLSYMPLVLPWSKALLPVNALWVLSVPLCGALAARRFHRLVRPSGRG
jgi:hypothetical protein